LFRNCAPVHRKPENAIAIHPTAEAVGFLAKAVIPLVALLLIGSVGVFSGVALAADDPQQVNFTLEGCRNDGSVVLPNADGQFICPDSTYTTGNRGWVGRNYPRDHFADAARHFNQSEQGIRLPGS